MHSLKLESLKNVSEEFYYIAMVWPELLCFITWTMLWIYRWFFLLPKMSKVLKLASEKLWVDTWQSGRARQARVVWIIVFVSLPRLPGPGLWLGRLPQTVWCWSCSPEVLSSGENPGPLIAMLWGCKALLCFPCSRGYYSVLSLNPNEQLVEYNKMVQGKINWLRKLIC